MYVFYIAIFVNTGLIQSVASVPISIGICSTTVLQIQIWQHFSFLYYLLYGVPPDFGWVLLSLPSSSQSLLHPLSP